MAKGNAKKNKTTAPKSPKENYLFVVNAWGYESGNWNWTVVDLWFDAMCRGEGSGMSVEQYYYQSTHGYLIVKLEKNTSKNVSHLYGMHHYREFLTGHPDDPQYATIFPYNYEKWGDPAKQQWSEEYRVSMPVQRKAPLREPYPIPEPRQLDTPPIDAMKWVRKVDEQTLQRLSERYAQAHPDWPHYTAPAGSSESNTRMSAGDADAAAEAFLASIIPSAVENPVIPVAGATADENEEDVKGDVKPGMLVKAEERKFKMDPEDLKLPPELLHGSFGSVKPEPSDGRVKMDEEDMKLPPELMFGSVGNVKAEALDGRIKVDEDGVDLKPLRDDLGELPEELLHGSVSAAPERPDYIKPEQGDDLQGEIDAMETSPVKREEEGASARIKEEQSEYSSGSYKRVKREQLP